MVDTKKKEWTAPSLIVLTGTSKSAGGAVDGTLEGAPAGAGQYFNDVLAPSGFA